MKYSKKIFLSSALKLSSNSTLFRRQDETMFITDIASNSVGTRLAYDFFEENWPTLFERYSLF